MFAIALGASMTLPFIFRELKVKVKWGAYAVSARSCGRSSPVSLAFEAGGESSLTPGHGASM